MEAMTSELIIKEQNPEVYAAIVKRIKNVPDPRSATVQTTYDEKWSIDAAWNRLLHELTSLSVDEEDGSLLETIQDNKLASQRNLRVRLIAWIVNYPMVMWTLTITNPTARRYIDVAVGNESMVAAITSRQITPELIDHICDTKTVGTLRQTKGGESNISDTFGVLKRSIRDEKFGKVWWIVAGVRLKDFNGDDIDKEFAYVFNNHQDDEALWPLIESGELDGTNFATIDVKLNSPPSNNYGHILRFAWDATLKNADTNDYDLLRKFIYHVWTPSNIAYPYVDDSLARYMVKTYHHKMGISSYILNSFVHQAYLNVWRDIIPYLQSIGARNYIPIGQIAILAHSIVAG